MKLKRLQYPKRAVSVHQNHVHWLKIAIRQRSLSKILVLNLADLLGQSVYAFVTNCLSCLPRTPLRQSLAWVLSISLVPYTTSDHSQPKHHTQKEFCSSTTISTLRIDRLTFRQLIRICMTHVEIASSTRPKDIRCVSAKEYDYNFFLSCTS